MYLNEKAYDEAAEYTITKLNLNDKRLCRARENALWTFNVFQLNGEEKQRDYYDARYPGDNFVIVTVDELREALEIMLDVVEAVNCWRTSHELEILIADPRGEFQSAMSRLKQKF